MVADLIIVGAGGTSREIAGAVGDINCDSRRWNLLGFLDDEPTKQGQLIDGLPVLGPIAAAKYYASCQFIVGIANSLDPLGRKRIVERMGLGVERFATMIHPSASISKHASIGAGTAILQNVVVTTNTVIGNHVLISQAVCMAHDDIVEDFVTIASGVVVSGYVCLRLGAYIGAGSILIPRVTVGRAALVGIGSVVMRDVPPEATVLGNPARLFPTARGSAAAHKAEI